MIDVLDLASPIMVVDDEEPILLAVETILKMAGLDNIITCQDSRHVADLLYKHQVQILLLDLTMPHVDGMELLPLLVREFPEIQVIIITGTIDVDTAVQCMKSGAFDYVTKPLEEARLLTAVSRTLAHRELKLENLALKEQILSHTLENPEAFAKIITNNKKMLSLFKLVECIAKTSQPVLITGETGVGKELIARVIHELSGRKGPFVAVNMAGIDDTLFADTLWGHSRGAYTGAHRPRAGLARRASAGTLFLDEIGDLSFESQAKLLRFIQEGEYLPLGLDKPRYSDARVVAATNRDLKSLDRAGKFRRDLYHRLKTHHLDLIPLRERMDDLPLLVEHFLEEAACELNKKKPTAPKELFTLLQTYSFSGNIRELRSMVFDAASLHRSKVLSLDSFKARIDEGGLDEVQPEGMEPDKNNLYAICGELPTIKQATHLLVAEAMQRADGNQSIAARLLGISQQALNRRLKKAPSEQLRPPQPLQF